MKLRSATLSDLPRIWQIIRQAKAQMVREGKHQWDENYPLEEHLRADILHEAAYVLTDEEVIIAYGAIVFDGEPAYLDIEGKWLSKQPYVVLHRLAVADEAKRRGVAVRFMQEVELLALSKGIHSFKVDTNYDNFYMQKVLQKCGFAYCGIIHYPRGNRWGYEKIIE
ncbi:MAG: GNAT family N-acetyltransferase [Bacteroides sp.]|nr:GNAT family N-acetyltransferase [Bacteroides sp.]